MSSLLNSSLNGSNPNLTDSAGRSFASSFSAQSGAASPAFHNSGTIQGLHNIHGNFNVPNMPGTLGSRNSSMANVPSSGVQQPSGSLSSGRFSSNNIPIALSQISHGNSGMTNRGGMNVVGSPGYSSSTNGVGSIPGIPPTSAAISNRNVVQGLGVSPMLGNVGPRITSSMGSMVGGGNLGRSMGSGGGLSVPGLASRINLSGNAGSGNLNVQVPNRLMSGMLQQASPQVMSMLGNSYQSAVGSLSQSHVQGINNFNSMGMLNDVNSNDSSPFDMNDFPTLTSRPNSAGGPQGQIGSLRKQGLGVSPIVQQNQEFSIQNEDFPALPGFKGGNAEYGMDIHQKEQLHDNNMSMMQSQHLPMGRSAGFNLGGGTYSLNRAPQQHVPSASNSGLSYSGVHNQDLLHLHISDMFPSSHSSYHSQTSGPPGLGLRPLNSPTTISSMGSYDQIIQQYQQHQTQNPFRLQQMSNVNQSYKSMQGSQAPPDPYGLLGLLSVIRMRNPDLSSLALGIDLTTLGLNLNAADNLYKIFGSPWSDEPAKGDLEFTVPQCYYAKQPPPQNQYYFAKFPVDVLFYIFYSMPKDEAQLYAAHELYNRGWFYHREHRIWFIRVPNMELLVKTNTYERGSYICFDPNTWETVRKDNFVVHYDTVEKNPALPQH